MTFVVPFDGSALGEAALGRAVELGDALDESVVAVSVVPRGNVRYARKRGWLDAGEPFDLEAVVSRLRDSVETLAPSIAFRHATVGQSASASEIGRELRAVARDVDASVVFVGSENAGRIVLSMTTVGSNVATDTAYDVYLVRSRRSDAD